MSLKGTCVSLSIANQADDVTDGLRSHPVQILAPRLGWRALIAARSR